MNAHGHAVAEQAKRALALAKDPRCPHGRERTTLLAALSMMRGHGYVDSIKVKLPDSRTALIPERDVHPHTMPWARVSFRSVARCPQAG